MGTRSTAPGLDRREFLSRTGLGGTLLAAGSLAARFGRGSGASGRPGPAGALRALFAAPPEAGKPMTRWWWFGGAVTPEEVTRELTFMKQAGLRGAEIQPVYPVAMDDPARGIRNLNYFSEEFLAVLRHAVREARRLELQLDFTLGSGWPYGGPFIPTSLAARRLRVLSQDVVGPRDYSWDLTPHLAGDDRVVRVVATPVREDAGLDVARSRVLADQPKPEVSQGVRRGSFVRTRVEERDLAPDGVPRLAHRPARQAPDDRHGRPRPRPPQPRGDGALPARGRRPRDERPGRRRGRRPSTRSSATASRCTAPTGRKDFLAEFEKRRGYDLAPYLPALFHDAGDVTPHVRHDAHLTLSELNLDYFFAPLVAWAESRGMKARIQAHGAPGDVMQAYGRAHIPEGENIFLGDRYQVNLRHRRLASSAAHLYGKPLASSETYTWLRTPLFVTTLEQMKPATDAVLLDGLNHIVNHGYSYSPPQAGEPGWSFYASTEANHTEHLVAALPAPGALHPADLRAAADGRRREPGGRLPAGRATCSPSSARAACTSTSRRRASSTRAC